MRLGNGRAGSHSAAHAAVLLCYCIACSSELCSVALSGMAVPGPAVVREQRVQFASRSGVEISSLERLMDVLRSCNRVTS